MLLATILLLILLAIIADLGRHRPVIAALAIVVSATVGTTLPDIDLSLGLGHRSGLTHSILPVIMAATRRHWRAIAAGLALGLAFHLAADLFPNAMRGYARVVLLGIGRLGATASYAWLAINAALALAGGVWLTITAYPSTLARGALGVVAVVGAAYLFRTDGGWWVLALLGLACCAICVFSRRRVRR